MASAETAGAAPVAASSGNSAPIGSFGTAKGSGLSRGKRVTPPAAPAASSAVTGGYKPTSVEVITSQSEYKNPFTGETTVRAIVNEPAPKAAPQTTVQPVIATAPPASAPTPAQPVASVPAPAEELFPFPNSGASMAMAQGAMVFWNMAPWRNQILCQSSTMSPGAMQARPGTLDMAAASEVRP